MNAQIRGWREANSTSPVEYRHIGESVSAPGHRGNALKNCVANRKCRTGTTATVRTGAETPESAAHYIATLAGELAEIARRNGLDTLSAILEMARLEADQVAEQ